MRFIKRKEFYYLLGLDIVCIVAALSLSLALRYDFRVPSPDLLNLHRYLALIVVLKIVFFLSFGLYQRIWQHAGIDDYLMIFVSFSLSSTVFFVINVAFTRQYLFPRSVILIDFLLTLMLISGIRISVRIFRKVFGRYRVLKSGVITPLKRVLIYGAGVGGEQIVREIDRNNFLRYDVIGFIDDDPSKRNMIIRNQKVLGKMEDVGHLIHKYKIDVILIAIPSLKGKGMSDLINYLQQYDIEIRTLPGQAELIDGNVHVNMIRPVQIEDLLGRETVELDNTSVSRFIKDNTVLITGAGGSIGSEIARQIIPFLPKKILLAGKGENSIFNIMKEMEAHFPEMNIEPVIMDVCSEERVKHVLELHKPDIIFHAAAHKHVYLMEVNPTEAFKTNVIGSYTLMKNARICGTKKFVLISTDKAVYPTSVMGATKRLAELVLSTFSDNTDCIFSAVRFGNVLGSRGSVIPIFKSQIEKGGPVTVTHPDALRYFMTIPEASRLVIQAGGAAKGGEIFILDMGTPVKILDLARSLIRHCGFIPDDEIEIKFIGLKPGEKLVEEILTNEEGIHATTYEKIFIAPRKQVEAKKLIESIDSLARRIYNIPDEEVRKEIFELVEKYS